MAGGDELLLRIAEATEEAVRWQRAAVLPQVRQTIERTLGTTQQRQAYEMCDGTTSGAYIAKAVGASPASISTWTRGWRDLGIAYENDDRKTRHLVSLESLGLPVKLDHDKATGRHGGGRSRRG